jgi:hypothetical protein
MDMKWQATITYVQPGDFPAQMIHKAVVAGSDFQQAASAAETLTKVTMLGIDQTLVGLTRLQPPITGTPDHVTPVKEAA